MKASEFRNMTADELHEKLDDLRDSLYRLRHRRAVEEDIGAGQVRENRKEIARVLTILRQRELTPSQEGEK